MNAPAGKSPKAKNSKAAKGKAKSPAPPARYDDLRALFINCTLKPSGGEPSHTDRLIHVAAGVMRANKVRIDVVCAVDLDLAPGVQPDMTKHGFERDDWPKLRKK